MTAIGVPTIFAGRYFDRDLIHSYVELAEDAGATAISVGDHMNFYTPTLECLTVAATVVARSDLPVVTNVVVAPLRTPFLLAKQAATVATLSRGGFALGIGVGGEHETEFAAAGVPVRERGARTDELLEILAGLRGGRVDHDGRYFRVSQAHLDPNPAVPLLVGGRSEPALRRAVRWAEAWSAAWVTPEQFAQRKTRLEALAVEAGRSKPLRLVSHVRVAVGNTPDSAWQDAAAFLARQYSADPEPFRRFTVCGPLDVVGEQLEAYLTAGAEDLLVTFAGADQLGQLEKFAPLLSKVERPWPFATAPGSEGRS